MNSIDWSIVIIGLLSIGGHVYMQVFCTKPPRDTKLRTHVLAMDEIAAIATEAQGHADHTTTMIIVIGEYGIGHTVSVTCPICKQGKIVADSSEW